MAVNDEIEKERVSSVAIKTWCIHVMLFFFQCSFFSPTLGDVASVQSSYFPMGNLVIIESKHCYYC